MKFIDWLCLAVALMCTFIAGVECAVGQYNWMTLNIVAAVANVMVVALPEIPEGT